MLVPVFEQLLEASPTFRAQVARIGLAPYVRVVVEAVMASSTDQPRQRTVEHPALLGRCGARRRRYSAPLVSSECAELFGHEFEHIIEQIDRVNLQALSAAGGAARLGDGAYETQRARSAGQRIAGEAIRSAGARAGTASTAVALHVEPAAAGVPAAVRRRP